MKAPSTRLWLALTAIALIVTYWVASAVKRGQSPVAAPGEIVVATWNIAPEKIEPRLPELTRAFTALNADVIALQEVESYSGLRNLVGALQKQGLDYEITMPEERDDKSLAVLTRRGIRVRDAETIPGSDAGNRGLRRAISVQLQVSSMTLQVVSLHNKSKRDGDNTEVRNVQCQAIREYLDDVPARGGLIVLGDYNMNLEDDFGTFKVLDPRGTLTFLSKPQGREVTQFSPGGKHGYYLDGFAVNRYLQGRTRNFQIYPMDRLFQRDRGWYRDHVSDHLPLVATVKVSP